MKFRINNSVGLVLAILIVTFGNVSCHLKNNTKEKRSTPNFNPAITEPFILTDYLISFREEAHLDMLRNRIKVRLPGFEGVESYAGYLNDETHGFNHYFWYFPAKENPGTAPVILYIEGTVRKNMFFSIFTQNGPFRFESDGRLQLRKRSWHNKHHMIYMDLMPGLGFSHQMDTESSRDMKSAVPYVLHTLLTRFFAVFPSIRPNPFFLAGSYYAWTHLSDLSYLLYVRKAGHHTESTINFEGIIIANGLVDTKEQLFFGDHLYTIGLIDDQEKKNFDFLEHQYDLFRRSEAYGAFYEVFNDLIMGDDSLFRRFTGYREPYNMLRDDLDPELSDRYSTWVKHSDNRRALHIGDVQPYQSLSEIALNNWKQSLVAEFGPRLEDVFQKHRVLIYTGNFDILCPYPSVERWLGSLSWPDKEAFTDAERKPWKDSKEELAGYIKRSRNIVEVVMINAGHHPCSDQPKRTLDLVEWFTHEKL